MLTPQQLQRMPQKLTRLMDDLEADILSDICRRLRLSGTVTESALHQIRMLGELGYSQQYIEERIQQTLDLGTSEIDAMFDEAVERNEEFVKKALDKSVITAPNRDWRAATENLVEAFRRQTHDEFRNITQSMGFVFKTAGEPKFCDAKIAYQRALDLVTTEVATGVIDYNTAIRHAVSRLAGSGLQYVDYASGHRDHADVAVRRAVMTGITQCAGRMSENTMELLDTRYVETEAHAGARDNGEGYFNHKSWQGKWFYWSRHGEPDPLGKYPDFIKTTGYGQGGGLCGWNCRHLWFPVIPGLDEPQYTQEQLDKIDPPPVEWRGEKYTAYAARQKQREMERTMRGYKRQLIASDASGDEETYNKYKGKLLALSKEYKAFSTKAKLPLQMERARIEGFGQKEAAKARRK